MGLVEQAASSAHAAAAAAIERVFIEKPRSWGAILLEPEQQDDSGAEREDGSRFEKPVIGRRHGDARLAAPHAALIHQPEEPPASLPPLSGGRQERQATRRSRRGSSPMATRTASSTRSRNTNSSLARASAGTSSRSFWFLFGSITVLMPARSAASVFSFTPPIGMTSPRSDTSPVMATSERTGMPVRSEMSARYIATPALGPSFGVAPAGTWMWRSTLSSVSPVNIFASVSAV